MNGDTASLASRLGVSEATVLRWSTGKTQPRPQFEAELRRIHETEKTQTFKLTEDAEVYHVDGAHTTVGRALDNVLNELREILHRKGQISSRNDALEEVAVLLFSHLSDIREYGQGATSLLDDDRISEGAAANLRAFVEKQLDKLGLTAVYRNGNGKVLHLGSNEDAVAFELISALRPLVGIDEEIRASSYDVLNEIFGKFISSSFADEKELGQYLTPPEVVSFMAALAANSLSKTEIRELAATGNTGVFGWVFDPSCGVGSLLSATAIELAKRFNDLVPRSKAISPGEILSRNGLGIDKSDKMLRLANLNFGIFGNSTPRLHLANSLARSHSEGELCDKFTGQAKIIVTNPPFGATFKDNDVVKYRLAKDWCRKFPGSIDSELLFLERYFDWLQPGGHLIAVVPDSVLTNKGIFADLRNGLARYVEVLEVISLPSIAFASAGTTTKTSVLHLQKRVSNSKASKPTAVAVCKDLGYDVVTRSGRRTKIPKGINELPEILRHLAERNDGDFIHHVDNLALEDRWDAQHHGALSSSLQHVISNLGQATIRVRDVADLINERGNPTRRDVDEFEYIEISDIDSRSLTASPKVVKTVDAPSRARKLTQYRDVLISTVRPERGTVGVNIQKQNPVVCTTGLAVLRPTKIEPLALATLLRMPEVIEQLIRHNVGIAYPAIEEECLPDIILPISKAQLVKINRAAVGALEVEEAAKNSRLELCAIADFSKDTWMNG